MSKAAGVLLIVAGVGAAAFVVPNMDATSLQTAGMSFGAAEPVATESAKLDQSTTADRGLQAPAVVPPTSASVSILKATSPSVGFVRPAASEPQKPLERLAAASQNGSSNQRDLSQERGSTSALTGDQSGKSQLARDIQSELRRVGCLVGDVDGVWNDATRKAMKTFIDRVNATLPVEQPDHILKTLVQGHPGHACNRTCSSGQIVAADGTCTQANVVAQAAKKGAAVAAANTETAGRGSIDYPVVVQRPKTKAMASSWEPVVTPAQPTVQEQRVAVAVPVAPAVKIPHPVPVANPVRAEPLPGRMAVGASAAIETPAQLPIMTGSIAAPAPKVVAEDAARSAKVDSGARKAIVIKPRVTNGATIAAKAPDRPAAETPVKVDEAAANATDAKASAKRPKADATVERDVKPVRKPAPVAVASRLPPPRYVGAYVAPSREVYQQRNNFGPSIFEKLAREGR